MKKKIVLWTEHFKRGNLKLFIYIIMTKTIVYTDKSVNVTSSMLQYIIFVTHKRKSLPWACWHFKLFNCVYSSSNRRELNYNHSWSNHFCSVNLHALLYVRVCVCVCVPGLLAVCAPVGSIRTLLARPAEIVWCSCTRRQHGRHAPLALRSFLRSFGQRFRLNPFMSLWWIVGAEIQQR